jgi:hypothetical protein
MRAVRNNGRTALTRHVAPSWRSTPGARPYDNFTVPGGDVNPDHAEVKPDNDLPEDHTSQTISEIREQIAVLFAADYSVESSRDRTRGLEQLTQRDRG